MIVLVTTNKMRQLKKILQKTEKKIITQRRVSNYKKVRICFIDEYHIDM